MAPQEANEPRTAVVGRSRPPDLRGRACRKSHAVAFIQNWREGLNSGKEALFNAADQLDGKFGQNR